MRALLIVVVGFASACFAPKIKDGQYWCATSNICPSGLICGGDGKCHEPEKLPDLLAVPYVGGGALGNLTFDPGEYFSRTEAGSLGMLGAGAIGRDVPADGGGTVEMEVMAAGLPGFIPQPQPKGGPQVAIWEFDNLTIPAGVTIRQRGRGAMALVAKTELTLDGTIDMRSAGGTRGAAGQDGSTGVADNAGAGKGSATAGQGGGGAGHARVGDSAPNTSMTGGGAYGNAEMTALQIGSGGGGGGGGSMAGPGGSGGGAIALLGTRLVIRGTIDASGSRPGNATAATIAGGGGGGSGGSILISAVQLNWGGSMSLRALGGEPSDGINGGTPGGKGSEGRIWRVKSTFTLEGGLTGDDEGVILPLCDPDPSFSPIAPLSAFPRP